MIVIIDYGSGNINAIANIYKSLKIPFSISSSSSEIQKAEKIILPGVGSFDHCMSRLNKSGLKEILNKKVLVDKVPVLGICIGLHLMANKSEEGNLMGLGWIDAEVKKFEKSKLIYKPKLPHMGWNRVHVLSNQELFKGINEKKGFYFIHSYYISVKNKKNIMTTTEYGIDFSSGINSSNIYAVQFHPEKSHTNGLKLLKNFSEINHAKI
jgi:glutamine amidotransferase